MRAGPKFAWLQLIQQRGHFAAALSGVAFAVTLMFSQFGLRDSLVNASIRLYKHLRGDIVMTSWEYDPQRGIPTIARHRFAEVLGVEGVESCSPLQIGSVPLRNPQNHQEHHITLVGFNPSDDLWDFDDKREDFYALKRQGAVLFDEKSRALYGPLAQLFAAKAPVPVILAKHQVDIVGLIDLGPGFNNDGYMFSSDATYDGLSMAATNSLPVIGVIRLKPGADLQQILQRLYGMMPNDVRFVERGKFLEQEKQYWLTQTPIGFLFSAFLILGLIIGSVVVYQILYSDVTSHLPEYATMKAMGYSDRKLFQLVLLQAVYLSVIGFVPGAIIAQVTFILLENKTLLPFAMTLARSFEVYLLTLAMCGISGAIAMLALRDADPAEIF
jgi:putative ABC transport system permease protein